MPKKGPTNKIHIIDRVCPLPENKYILDADERKTGKKRELGLPLANKDVLETCPVASLDPWSVEMWVEYKLREKFNSLSDLPEIMWKAFSVILIQELKIDGIEQKKLEHDLKQKNFQNR